jgi:hypothetical protein
MIVTLPSSNHDDHSAILVLIALLARDRSVMGRRRSGPWSNGLVWAATCVMGVAAIALILTLF